MMADLMAEALQVVWRDLMLPARPETWGHDMEVPEMMLYCEGFFPFGTSSASLPIHAARMSTPGAAISGYKENRFALSGSYKSDQAITPIWFMTGGCKCLPWECSLIALKALLMKNMPPLVQACNQWQKLLVELLPLDCFKLYAHTIKLTCDQLNRHWSQSQTRFQANSKINYVSTFLMPK